MADPERLSAEQREFIESWGVFFEYYGVPRLVGRMLGLLVLADRPLTLDDMAHALLISRASVSTNIRIALHFGYTKRVGIPGDRRDYYRFSDEFWERRIQISVEASKLSLAKAEQGLAVLGPEDISARERLDEMRDFCLFSIEESQAMLARWRERKRTRLTSRQSARAPYAGAGYHADAHTPHTGHAGASDEHVAVERDT